MAGRDYPRTYREFAARFPDEAACSQFLEAFRRPQGFTCPACGVVHRGATPAGAWYAPPVAIRPP